MAPLIITSRPSCKPRTHRRNGSLPPTASQWTGSCQTQTRRYLHPKRRHPAVNGVVAVTGNDRTQDQRGEAGLCVRVCVCVCVCVRACVSVPARQTDGAFPCAHQAAPSDVTQPPAHRHSTGKLRTDKGAVATADDPVRHLRQQQPTTARDLLHLVEHGVADALLNACSQNNTGVWWP